jgi:hypothetical protein
LLDLLLVALATVAAPSAPMTKDQALVLAKQTLHSSAEGAIEVVAVTEMEWPDAGLGCPEKGQAHPPDPTPGFRVLLKAGGRVYRVHVGAGRALLCGAGLGMAAGELKAEEGGGGPGEHEAAVSPDPDDPAGRKLVTQAKEDLAHQLSIPLSAISLLKFKEVVWPDSSLGCPRPGLAYTQVLQPGFLIRLSARGRSYEFHAGARGAPFLCSQPRVP